MDDLFELIPLEERQFLEKLVNEQTKILDVYRTAMIDACAKVSAVIYNMIVASQEKFMDDAPYIPTLNEAMDYVVALTVMYCGRWLTENSTFEQIALKAKEYFKEIELHGLPEPK